MLVIRDVNKMEKTSLLSVLYRNDTREAEAEQRVEWFVCPNIYILVIKLSFVFVLSM